MLLTSGVMWGQDRDPNNVEYVYSVVRSGGSVFNTLHEKSQCVNGLTGSVAAEEITFTWVGPAGTSMNTNVFNGIRRSVAEGTIAPGVFASGGQYFGPHGTFICRN